MGDTFFMSLHEMAMDTIIVKGSPRIDVCADNVSNGKSGYIFGNILVTIIDNFKLPALECSCRLAFER